MIKDLLKNKTAKERANIKGQEIAKVDFRGEYISSKYGVKIDIQKIEAIEGGVQVFARAWKGNKQLGFGKDGSVEIERFRMFNPPIFVDDPNGDIIKEIRDENIKTGEFIIKYKTFREDPAEATKQSLAYTVTLVGKENTKITKGKVGKTSSEFNPSLDGSVRNDESSSTWSSVHNAGTGTLVNYDTNSADIRSFVESGSRYIIDRMFLLFDTSALGSDTIDIATLSIYVNSKVNQVNDGNDFINIYTTSPASDSALVTADYDQIGTTVQSTSIDIGSVSTSAYNAFVLNATGEGNIDGSGVTKFGVREGHDVTDNTIGGGSAENVVRVAMTEDSVGDPKLVVEHSPSSVAYTTSVADGLSLGDVLAKTYGTYITQADSVSLSDSIPYTTSFLKTISDSVSLSDSSSFISTFTRTISEALSLSDTISAAIVIPISVTESISLSDTKALVTSFTKTISDTFSLSDAVTTIKGLSATISESISLSDSATMASIIAITVSESITLVDSIIKGGWSWINKATDTTWNFINKNTP